MCFNWWSFYVKIIGLLSFCTHTPGFMTQPMISPTERNESYSPDDWVQDWWAVIWLVYCCWNMLRPSGQSRDNWEPCGTLFPGRFIFLLTLSTFPEPSISKTLCHYRKQTCINKRPHNMWLQATGRATSIYEHALSFSKTLLVHLNGQMLHFTRSFRVLKMMYPSFKLLNGNGCLSTAWAECWLTYGGHVSEVLKHKDEESKELCNETSQPRQTQ